MQSNRRPKKIADGGASERTTVEGTPPDNLVNSKFGQTTIMPQNQESQIAEVVTSDDMVNIIKPVMEGAIVGAMFGNEFSVSDIEKGSAVDVVMSVKETKLLKSINVDTVM